MSEHPRVLDVLDSQEARRRAPVTRLEQCLAKVSRYSAGVMTLGEFLKSHPPVSKRIFTRDRFARKTHLCYPTLVKPVQEYCLFRDADLCISVAKVVYNSIDVPLHVDAAA